MARLDLFGTVQYIAQAVWPNSTLGPPFNVEDVGWSLLEWKGFVVSALGLKEGSAAKQWPTSQAGR